MQDIYAALMGEPVSEEEKMQALARKLATQRSMGQTGQILGGRMLEKPSAQMIGAADKSALEMANFAEQKRNQEQNAMMAEEARIAAAKQDELQRQFTAGEKAKDRALSMALEQMQQAGANQRASSDDAKAEAAAKKELDRYTRMYGQEREKVGLPDMQSYITDADKVLSKYEGKSIPGIGVMDFSSKFTQEGSDVRQAVGAVRNALLKALSGAAVTESEAQRLEDQMFGPFATEKSFRNGWTTLKNAISAKEKNIDQSYDPLIVETYRSRNPSAKSAGAPASGGESGELSFEEFKRRRAAGEL